MGNPNSAYYFDGVDDYIKIPGGAGTNLNPSGALSVAMYFYPTRHQVATIVGQVNYTDGSGIQFQAAMDFSLYPGVMFGVNSPATGCSTIHLNDSYTNSVSPITLPGIPPNAGMGTLMAIFNPPATMYMLYEPGASAAPLYEQAI